jgi:hypothetical protein
MLTRQQLFDNAWNWFVVEKKERSYNKYTRTCLYRGPNGTKCAIGVSIPDNKYDPGMENRGIRGIMSNYEPNLGRVFDKNDLDFLAELQQVHDNLANSYHISEKEFTELIEDKLRAFAKKYNLGISTDQLLNYLVNEKKENTMSFINIDNKSVENMIKTFLENKGFKVNKVRKAVYGGGYDIEIDTQNFPTMYFNIENGSIKVDLNNKG